MATNQLARIRPLLEAELLSSGRQRVQLFCGRLKYARFMRVVRVEEQKAETLARSVLSCVASAEKRWLSRRSGRAPWGSELVVRGARTPCLRGRR